ncbi:predicted protein [Postia placenta Mad-698-R]|nr:predicted protein [Postia placenta Mad-698-R]
MPQLLLATALRRLSLAPSRVCHPALLEQRRRFHFASLAPPLLRNATMPPKRAASGSSRVKRKAPLSESESPEGATDSEPQSRASSPEPEEKPRTKKAKVDKPAKAKAEESGAGAAPAGDGALAPNGQPTNKVIPVHVSIPPRVPGTTRIATWNICGLAAAQKKVRVARAVHVHAGLLTAGVCAQGFKYYVEAEDADVLVLTETKPVPVSVLVDLGEEDLLELPGHPDPGSVKGRILTLEFSNYYLIGTYVVNAGQGLKTLEAKKEWNVHFTKYMRELDMRKPVIWTGDLNVAPTELDLANPKTNWNKTPGYTEVETSAFARILNPSSAAASDAASQDDAAPGKFVDVWRKLHPDDRHYTYFSYRFNCRMKGIGWRLDMFVVSERIEERVKMCEIRSEIYGASDHCPVALEIEGEL